MAEDVVFVSLGIWICFRRHHQTILFGKNLPRKMYHFKRDKRHNIKIVTKFTFLFFSNEETKKKDLENLLQEPTTIHRTMRCHPVMFQNTKMPSIFSCEVYLLPPHNEVIRDQLRPKSSAFIASYIACCFFFFRDSNHVVNFLSNRSRYIQIYIYILYRYHIFIYHYMNVYICYLYIYIYSIIIQIQ